MIFPPEITALQKRFTFFDENLTENDFANVIPFIHHKTFRKGEIILNAGDVCKEFYFITQGLLRSFHRMSNGSERTYVICRENNIFTDHSSFISQTPSTDFIEAIEDTEVLYISYEDLMTLYKNYHAWESVGRKVSDINFVVSKDRLRSMMNDDAITRYKRFLHSYQNILHRIPQHIVASYLGITPQSLSRLKKGFEQL
jgi:CRP-like cAMP-binding protein